MIGLKGVSRSVIELNKPESPYFERVVLYLKPNLRQIPARDLLEEADRLTEEYTRTSRKRRTARLLHTLLIAAAGGAACTLIAVWIK